MEYCSHCRAIRPTRKSTRRRTVRQPDGTTKILIVDSYHCTRCQHFIGSIERDAAPERPVPAEAPAGPAEEVEEVEAAQGSGNAAQSDQ